ncbi:hypothetical protein ACFQX6_03170 [Streptosporangium lutulentum]
MTEPEWARRDLLKAHGMAKEVDALAPRVRTVTDGQEIFPGVRVRITATTRPGMPSTSSHRAGGG